MKFEFGAPGRFIHFGEGGEVGLRKREPAPINIGESRHPAQRRFRRADASVHPVDDPLQHAHVLAKPRPEELTRLVAPEPVNAKKVRLVRD